MLATASKARDDYGHIVGLFRRACPFFRGGKKRIHHHLGAVVARSERNIFEAARAELFAGYILWLDETVAEYDEQRAGIDADGFLLIIEMIEDADDGATDFEVEDFIAADAERRGMTCVGVAQFARCGIINREEKCGEA